MATHVEKLLTATLSPFADYATKQLIKTGDLGQAAANVLKARRKSLTRQQRFFSVMIIVPLLLNLCASIALSGSGPIGRPDLGLELFSFLALMQVPGIIDLKASITRLETVLTTWLLEDPDSHTEADGTLAQLLTQSM